MYKVLIVDDELNIVKGLQVLIDWDALNCRIVGTGADGREGLDLALELQPDIIITDIRMPHIDGLAMVARLREMESQARFIILSGYSSFEYAQQGIDLGVRSYVLKPVEEKDLIRCLQNVIAEIEADRKRQETSNQIMRDNALREIVGNCFDDDQEIQRMLKMLDIQLCTGQFACLVFDLSDQPREQARLTARQMAGLFKCQEDSAFRFYFRYNDQKSVLIINHPELSDPTRYHNLVGQIREYLIEQGVAQTTVGVGKAQEDIRNLAISFEQACFALSFKIIKEPNSIIFYQDIEHTPSRLIGNAEDLVLKLKNHVQSGSPEQTRAIVDYLFNELLRQKNLTPLGIQLEFLNILLVTMRSLSGIQVNVEDIISENGVPLWKIMQYDKIEDLKHYVTAFVDAIIRIRMAQGSAANKNVIEEIKRYILDSGNLNLNLDDIARQFYMNPFYISQLFRKKTGETFMNYITGVRIQKAKELLLTTDRNIYEIAAAVGYENIRYFSDLFRKIEGRTPSDFRRQKRS